MTAAERRLLRHLAVAVLLKLALLAGLWSAFVRGQGQAVDSETAAAHLGSQTRQQTSSPGDAQ